MGVLLPLARLVAVLSCASLARAQLSTPQVITCADKEAAGINTSIPANACVVPYDFSTSPTVPTFLNHPLPVGWSGPAPICYTQYYQNQLATPTFMPRNSTCSAYANRGCCSSEMVMSIDNGLYGTVDPYPGYSSRCGPLSPLCQQFFNMEACFYECDPNIGRYRMYQTCLDGQGDQNAWQILNMPMKSSQVDAWFNACANDLFCTGPSGSYFDLPSASCVPPVAPATSTPTCRRFSDIYGNASNMIVQMWDSSFSYDTSGNGFTFPTPGTAPFDAGQVVNPNTAQYPSVPNPPFCSFRPVTSGWQQAWNDFKLYAANMLAYTNTTYSGAIYGLNVTTVPWFYEAATTAASPPAACNSGALGQPMALLSLAGAALAAALLA